MKVIAYQVTAVRGDFRRLGRTFKLGVATMVDASALTPAQAAFLEASNPRELRVDVVRSPEVEGIGTSPSEHELPAEGAEDAAPSVDVPTEDASAGEPSDEPSEEADEGDSDSDEEKDDQEPSGAEPVEGAAPTTSTTPPAPRRKKGKRK